jgi:glutamyl-tRNA synthetase
MQNQVRTRMAPSPTGEMHVGGLAMSLKNYAWAKRNHGSFILRIEDTDQTREVEGAVARIEETLLSFGLKWDEGPSVGGKFGPYTQSERLKNYQDKARHLVEMGHAYYCFCSKERLQEVREQQVVLKQPPKYDGHCRQLSEVAVAENIEKGLSYVIRLKVPQDENLSFTDLLRGEISFNTNTIDDQVLLKSDGFPTYHLAVVIDDHEMEISHVFRGEEWISSAPKHILLYRNFGWDIPVFVHFPVFLDPSGKGKMSKRSGAVSVESFLEQGYLPKALLNFLMILGWSPKDENEVMNLERYVSEFDPADVSSKSVKFDIKKLQWLNGIYIRQLSIDELAQVIKPFLPDDFPKEKVMEILPLVSERLVLLGDITDLTDFFYRAINLDTEQILKKSDVSGVKEQLRLTLEGFEKILSWETEEIEKAIRTLQETHDWHRGQYFMMLRTVLTGKKATPPLFETIKVLGRELATSRLDSALQKL